MSVKLEIFNDIVSQIESKAAAILTTGLWNNQFANEDVEKAFNFPCVFIEFSDINWDITTQRPSKIGAQGNASKQQKGDPSIIVLHIGFAPLDDETVSFPIIDPIIQSVYLAIQGLDGTNYGPLLRQTERQDTDHNRVIDWQMDFSMMMEDVGEEDATLTKIDADTLALETTKDLDIEADTTGGVRTGPES